MEIFKKLEGIEKTAIKWQLGIFIVDFILGVPILLLSQNIFHTMRFGLLGVCVLISFIGISSIKSQISILKPGWQKEFPKGKQAVIIGVLFIVGEIITVFIFFSPFFPEGF
jgi:hypothetical protein